MGSAKGWAFENESECLNFVAGGGTPLNHKTISQQVVSGLGDDGELLCCCLLLGFVFDYRQPCRVVVVFVGLASLL